MRMLRGMIAGALALGGLMVAQTEASARPIAAPELISVSAAQSVAKSGASALPCQYYGWRRHYGYRRYGWRRPFYGYRHYGWRRLYYGWHRHYGWRPHYGWRRRFY